MWGGSKVTLTPLVSGTKNQYSVVKAVCSFCDCDSHSVGVPAWLFRKSNTSLLFKNNSLERAVDWIFSHIDDLDAEAAMDISEGRSAADSISESVPVGPKVRDGPGSECPPESG